MVLLWGTLIPPIFPSCMWDAPRPHLPLGTWGHVTTNGSCHFISQGMGYTVTVGLGAETERKTNGKSPWDKIGDSLWWTQGREDRSTVSNGIKWITAMKEIFILTGKMQCFQVFNKSICWIHECRLISLIAIDYQPISQSVSTSALTTLSTPDTLRKLHGKYSGLLSKRQKQQQLTATKGVVLAKRLKLKSSQ